MDARHVREIVAAILTTAKMVSGGVNGSASARAPEAFVAEYDAMLAALKGAKPKRQQAGVSL